MDDVPTTATPKLVVPLKAGRRGSRSGCGGWCELRGQPGRDIARTAAFFQVETRLTSGRGRTRVRKQVRRLLEECPRLIGT